jgi:hypothetical protein
MFVASMFVEEDHASSRQPGNRGWVGLVIARIFTEIFFAKMLCHVVQHSGGHDVPCNSFEFDADGSIQASKSAFPL